MRIGVSARSLAYPSGGPTEYLINLMTALLRLDAPHEWVVFHADTRRFDLFPQAENVSLDTRNRLVFDWLKLPRALARHGADLAFFPSSNMPPGVPCPAVVAMLDLGYFHEAFRMYRLPDTLYMRPMIKYAARRAERLIAISEHTRRDLLRRTAARPEKIAVTPLAADPVYREPVSPEAVAAFRQRRALKRDFFLYAGNISPRKNLRTLLAALALVKDQIDLDLAVTGGRVWDQDWERLLAQSGLKDRVRRLGHVPGEEMPLLYRAAAALVFPSLFEGFGLPVLEAQACGLPVVCSNATALPEAAGDGAYYFDPHDVSGLAQALAQTARDPELRARLTAKGRENERRFSWEKTARETLAAFEAARAD